MHFWCFKSRFFFFFFNPSDIQNSLYASAVLTAESCLRGVSMLIVLLSWTAAEVYGYYLITHELFFFFSEEAFEGKKTQKTYCFVQIKHWRKVNYKHIKGVRQSSSSSPFVLIILNGDFFSGVARLKTGFCWEHRVITIVTNDGLISFFFFRLRKLYPDFGKRPRVLPTEATRPRSSPRWIAWKS